MKKGKRIYKERRIPALYTAVCVLVAAALGLLLFGRSRAYAADIPAAYPLSVTNITDLGTGDTYAGITRTGDKQFDITGTQGFNTLARVSQTDSLEGYTFRISARDTFELKIASTGNAEEDLANSFYGIGSETIPFKGKIFMTNVTGSTYLKMTGWKVLFNNLSNEGAVTSDAANINLRAHIDGPFSLCEKLTITKSGTALDISGFRFAARNQESDGSVRGVVQTDKAAGLVAAQVTAGTVGGDTGTVSCSVDVSACFETGSRYALESTAGTVGGLFGSIDQGAAMSVTSGNMDLLVSTAAGGNAGLLVGENSGIFTVSSGSTYTGSVTAAGGYAAGLVGVNGEKGTVNFAENITVSGLTASGAYAGGAAGRSEGSIVAAAGKTCTVSGSTFTSADGTPTLGGAVGQATAAPAGNFVLENNRFAKSGNVGGFIGGFTAKEAASFQNVTVTGSVFSGTGGAAAHSVGGYFGLLKADNTVKLQGNMTLNSTFSSMTAGSYGGVIGKVTGTAAVTVGGKSADGPMTLENVFDGSGGTLGGAVGTADTGARLTLDNLALHNTMSAMNSGMADLVGNGAAKAVLNIGTVTYRNENKDSVLVSTTGSGTVMRLYGALTDNSASSGHIVRTQSDSLLFADTGFAFSRTGTLTSNDVGNYGQILRNDTLQILTYDAADHTVTVKEPLPSASDITLASAADAAKLALTLQTHGVFSGVENITANNYASLLSASTTITLRENIDLRGSGVEQFTPAYEREVFFKGKILGNNHILTLAIGESARTKESEDTNVGILNDGVNMRYFIGAFSGLSGATVEQVTVAGDLKHYADAPSGFFFGGLAGYAKYTSITIKDCTSNVNITLADGTAKASIYVGGFLGSIQKNVVVSITGSTTNATINLKNGYGIQAVYLGGVVGRVTTETNKDIVFTDNIISASITQNVNATNAHVGGCFGDLICSNYINVDMTGTKAVNASVTSASSTSAGGLIGHTVQKCRLVLDGPWQGTVSSGGASVGGLIYDLDGKLTVKNGFSVSGSAFTSTNGTKGILVAEGTQAFVIVDCKPAGFQNVTADGFDLFVGRNIRTDVTTTVDVAASGGLVTVETSGANIGQIPEASDWYALIQAHQNTKTRYYFNIARLDQAAEGKYTPGSTAKSQADVIYWHVYDYVQGTLPDYVRNESFSTAVTNITGATGDIDMTNYSLYPSKMENVTFAFSGNKLTFGYTVADLPRTGQMFGIQSGILSDVIATDQSVTASLSDITLAGTVYPVSGVSGAFICGVAEGNRTSTVTADVTVNVEKVFFDGLQVSGAETSGYSPLLINRLHSNVIASITSVSQYTSATYEKASKRNTYGSDVKAATSLIGYGGESNENNKGSASSNISVRFKNIVFAGETGSSIFTHASYFEAINCINGTGVYVYNFNLAEDWDGTSHVNAVTYGTEISTNPKQYEYYDQEILVDPASPNKTGSVNTAFQTGYMPYVLATMSGGTSLRVNQKSVNFDKGWGTYENPYVIDSAAQLAQLADMVSMSDSNIFAPDWIINYPKTSGSGLDYTDYDVYRATAQGKLAGRDNTALSLSAATLREYLRGAYYTISAPMELTEDFTGIGTEKYPFHGVVVGNQTTITMPDNTAVGNTGYCGFINVANGCAVFGLKLEYGTIQLSGNEFGTKTATNYVDSEVAATTGTTHFGGVIGWIIGGDNLIDTVTVTIKTLKAGHVSSVYGGYVGLISGGGVSLRGLGETPVSMAGYEGYYYYNPYVGKVLSGYAMSNDVEYDNTAKNFSIPLITNERLARGCKTGWVSGLFEVELADADDLLMLGFAMNGGALEYDDSFISYGQGALSRHGDYRAVGAKTGLPDGLKGGQYEDDLSGGGKSLFLSYFALTSASDMRATELSLKLTGEEYDLSKYPNAFRGLGSPLSGSNCYNIQKVTGLADNQGRAKTAIKLATDIKQYYKSWNNYEPDAFKNLGLVLERRNSNNTITFSNVKLTGEMSLGFVNLNGNAVTDKVSNNAFCVGGYMGYVRNAVFNTAEIENLTVRSPGWAAGFVASEEYDWKAQSIPNVVSHCYVTGLDVKGIQSTGGLFGYLRVHAENAARLSDVQISDSAIRVDSTSGGGYNSSNNNMSAGGVIGLSLNQGNTSNTVSMSDITVERTAVIAQSPTVTTGASYDAGGFVGRTESPMVFKGCTLDGSVVACATAVQAGVYPTEYTANTVGISGTVYEKVANAVAAALNVNVNAGADGNAGGFVGVTNKNNTFSGCTIKSDEATTVILGYSNGSGMVGNALAAVSYSFTDVSIQATKNPLYIIGRSCSGGLLAWDGNGGEAIAAQNIRVTGSDGKPVYIIGTKTSGSVFSGGLFGEVNKKTVTVTDAEISGCVIASMKVAGVINKNIGSLTNLSNIKLYNNYLQNTVNNSAAGVVNTVSGTVNLSGLYMADNMIRSVHSGKISAGGIVDTIDGGKTLNGSDILMKGNDMAFTKAGKKLADILALQTTKPDVPKDTTNKKEVGLIGYENKGTANILALSSEADEKVNQQPRFRSESSTSKTAVIFAGYGAPSVFEAEYITKGNTAYTPAQALADHGTEPKTTGKLNGDAVTKTLGSATPDYLNANLANWAAWKKGVALEDTGVSTLSALAENMDITENKNLSVLHITGSTNDTMTGFLNLITGGGYGDMANAFTLAAQADRYTLESDGTLTLQAAGDGSVQYNGTKFTAGKYDDLESENKSLTVLTLTFTSKAVPAQTYSMHVVVYYPQILEYKSYISALEGEVYQISSFVTDPKYTADVSAGSAYSLYVEYVYNDTAAKIEDFNFEKRIESGTQDGAGTGDKSAFAAGTTFVLVDLNSPGAYGFKSYYYTAAEETYSIDFKNFTSEAKTAFSPKLLSEVVANKLGEKKCIGTDDECTHVERYILTVIPQGAENEKKLFTLRAEMAENDKNIIVKNRVKQDCKVSVWNRATGDMKLVASSATFSNVAGKELVVNADVQVTFPTNYIVAMKGRNLYGAHVFTIVDADQKTVPLPAGTKVLLTDAAGNTLMASRLTGTTASLRYEIDDIIAMANNQDSLQDSFTLTLDFSEVSAAEFNGAFPEGKSYTMSDNFYISSDRAHFTSGSKMTGKTGVFTAKSAVPVKLTVIPVDRKHQAINMGGIQDSTDSGQIEFNLTADFSAVPETDREKIVSAKVEFFVYQKDLTTHAYGTTSMLGQIASLTPGNGILTLTDWKADGRYTLTVDLDYVKAQMAAGGETAQQILSNYRLAAKVTGLDANGDPVGEYTAESYFVFLLCDIQNQITG